MEISNVFICILFWRPFPSCPIVIGPLLNLVTQAISYYMVLICQPQYRYKLFSSSQPSFEARLLSPFYR